MTTESESATTSRAGFKVAPDHSAECWFAAGDEAFVVYDGWEYRDAIGRRTANGHGQWWHRFICNDPSCDAVALVRWDTLAAFVTAGVEATREPATDLARPQGATRGASGEDAP